MELQFILTTESVWLMVSTTCLYYGEDQGGNWITYQWGRVCPQCYKVKTLGNGHQNIHLAYIKPVPKTIIHNISVSSKTAAVRAYM